MFPSSKSSTETLTSSSALKLLGDWGACGTDQSRVLVSSGQPLAPEDRMPDGSGTLGVNQFLGT